MQRIAPNNQLPATHFVEMYNDGYEWNYSYKPVPIKNIIIGIGISNMLGFKTIAIFRIRENKLPTKHKF